MSETTRRHDLAFALLSPNERARAAAIGPRDVALLVFRVGDERFGVELHRTREILRARRPTPVPHQPPWLEGVLSVRGVVVPVLDVALRLGLRAERRDDADRLVVVHVQRSEPAALRVREVLGVARFRPELVREPRQPTPFVRALAEEEELVRVLDVDALFERPGAPPVTSSGG